MPVLGVVVPVRNEREVLPLFWTRLQGVRRAMLPFWRLEVVFVDDASCDGSGAWLDALAQQELGVRVVHAPSALGQQGALFLGLAQAPGEAVVTLDADLQDPPESIADMAALWQQGADVVYGVRLARPGDSVGKRASAALFYRLLSLLSHHPIPADAGDFRLIGRPIVHAVQVMPTRRLYLRGMVARAGGRQVAYAYARAPRGAGSSSYTLFAMGRLAWAGVLSCAAPWRLAGCVAGMMAAAATASAGHSGDAGALHWAIAGALLALASAAALVFCQRQAHSPFARPRFGRRLHVFIQRHILPP